MPTITALATSDLPKTESAAGSAVVQMGRQLGSVLGNAVLVAVLRGAVATGAQARFLDAWWVTVGAYAAGAVISLRLLPWRPAAGPPAAETESPELAQTETS
jgi:hypothetical protein